jgi:hypothetical protein
VALWPKKTGEEIDQWLAWPAWRPSDLWPAAKTSQRKAAWQPGATKPIQYLMTGAGNVDGVADWLAAARRKAAMAKASWLTAVKANRGQSGWPYCGGRGNVEEGVAGAITGGKT